MSKLSRWGINGDVRIQAETLWGLVSELVDLRKMAGE
jgi:hypothetical protein